jgi:hypothetical protein
LHAPQGAAMTSIFFIAKEDIHEAHPSVCEGMGRSESGKSALHAGILRDDRSFWSSQRINDAADRQLSRPNNKER